LLVLDFEEGVEYHGRAVVDVKLQNVRRKEQR
jgi:hypothetical protein